MRRVRLSALLIGLIAILALVAAGCGGSDDEGSGSGDTGGTAPSEGKQGGDLTFLAAADVDYLDPGQSYYTFGYQVLYSTNRPLYSFAPGDEEQQPDLADGDPQISEDKKTVTVKIKPDVKYAPPVDRAVVADDIKYAIERAFSANVPSGYATSYFGDIVGAPDAPTKGVKDIEGITATDDTTLVIKLDRPVGESVAQALVMPITVPVPQDYAEKYDQKSPSEYDQYVAFTGPYMVKNDPTTGKVTGRDPGKRIELVRNPNWNKDTDYRPAYLDSITIEEGNDDLTVASRRTLSATTPTMCCDSGQPPIPVLSRAITRQQGADRPGLRRWHALDRAQHHARSRSTTSTSARPSSPASTVTRSARPAAASSSARSRRASSRRASPASRSPAARQGFTDIDYMAEPEGRPGGHEEVPRRGQGGRRDARLTAASC